ncbi:MAG: alpha/beta hydrolase [Myxococcota bacterium]|nr:alpha/beta hydrolase [Myxococcota bacterium]
MHDISGLTATAPRIRYWSAGARGEKILFVMGFGMKGDIWQSQIVDLKKDHHVAWFDNRGIGDSETSKEPVWTMKTLASDAKAVLDALEWRRCHLVGVSLGGMIAQELALADQRRFLSLTLIATHDGGPVRRKIPPLRGVKNFLKANLARGPERIDALRTLLYTDEFAASSDQTRLNERLALQLGRPASRATTARQLLAVIGHDTRKRLRDIIIPTLVMKPGQDILVRATGSERLAREIPNARLVTFPNSGHGMIFQEAEGVNTHIRRHVLANTRQMGS